MKVVVAKDARDQANDIDAWWRENRPEAPDMFQAELIAALQLLADAPNTGTRYERNYRRVRLQRTRHNVFYEVDRQQDVLTVVAVWGMPKGKMPKL